MYVEITIYVEPWKENTDLAVLTLGMLIPVSCTFSNMGLSRMAAKSLSPTSTFPWSSCTLRINLALNCFQFVKSLFKKVKVCILSFRVVLEIVLFVT